MAKQVIHVGLAVATDGFYPGKANIVSLAASLGQVGNFSINIRPKDGVYGESPFWEKHLNEWVELRKDPESLEAAMTKFRSWLRQWQGNLIACTSSIDFWHLFVAMFDTGKDCPFGSQPLDTNSYYAGMEGRKTPIRIMAAVRPIEVAHQRWEMVTKGVIPKFGPAEKAPPKLKLRLSSDTIRPYRDIPPPPTVSTWRGEGPTNPVPTPARPMTNRRFTSEEVSAAINSHDDLLRQQQAIQRLQQEAMQNQAINIAPQSFEDFRRQRLGQGPGLTMDSASEAWDTHLDPPEEQ